MRLLHAVCLLLVAQGIAGQQAGAQQADSAPKDSNVSAEVRALREALSQTEKKVASQQQEIEFLKQNLQGLQPATAPSVSNEPQSERAIAANEHTTTPWDSQPPTSRSDANVAKQPKGYESHNHRTQQESSQSSFKIDDAVLTVGGFVDFENVFRTTNTQNNIATAFAAIPFSNTTQGRLTEFRSTAQYSRLNLKVTDKFGANDLLGYIEGDFSGNDAAGVYQTVNGHTNRLRLYFMDWRRGKWEFLGGQTWSWLTPNRRGLGPMPTDLAITYNEDQNIGVGLPYTRAAEFRVAYHPNDHWAMGVGIENPNQFIGGFVALPAAFSTMLSPQFDNGSQIGAPNLFPDIISKIAYDTALGARHFHFEITGLLTGVRAGITPVGGKSFSSNSVVGGGGQIALNYELRHNLLFLANGFWSDGGARYLVAAGPQVVIRPNAAGTNVAPSMVHSGAGMVGLEWIVTPKTALAVYYGADYFERNFFPDTTNTAHPNTVIGYGGPGSPNTNNRAIQEVTLDWIQTFWKHPKYGAVQYYTQYSYLTRAPWFVAPGTPKNAHLSMVYAGIRYVLPSTSGTLQRVPYPN